MLTTISGTSSTIFQGIVKKVGDHIGKVYFISLNQQIFRTRIPMKITTPFFDQKLKITDGRIDDLMNIDDFFPQLKFTLDRERPSAELFLPGNQVVYFQYL